MRSSLKKLKGFAAIHKNDPSPDKRGFQPSPHLDELAQAAQDMEDMKSCYDSLLSAAAATANSAYEFSESLRDMGSCLLEKTALDDDENSGKVLLMLGKVQFELQRLVDKYRSHIFQTITTPSESLLSELRTVEDMKRQCDEKRTVVEEMMAASRREKGRPRNFKGENISSQQLQTAHDEYDEEATLFVFRLKSLKQGQSRSLLTQAARHHAAQLNFFKNALRSLEAVEPHVKLVAERHHIDYHFSGLDDDDQDDGDEDESCDTRDDGELSFDYGQNEHCPEVSTSRNSMELDQVELAPVSTTEAAKEGLDNAVGGMPIFGRRPMVGSQSAPILPEKKSDTGEKIIKDVQPLPTRKYHSYVLPTPVDAKNLASTRGSSYLNAGIRETSTSGHAHNLWHSSPLEPNRSSKDGLDDRFSGKPHQSILKESNVNNASAKIPPPLAEGLSQLQSDHRTASDHKKIKRQSFSGPLTSKPWSSRPTVTQSGPSSSAEQYKLSSFHQRIPPPQPSSSPKVSPSTSPPLISSPKISELHELPRPPVSAAKATRPASLIGHSAPLVPRSQELSTTNKQHLLPAHTASPLPAPPKTVPRSYSIPSSGQRATSLSMSEFLNSTRNSDMNEDVTSPPLTPITLMKIQPASKTAGSNEPSSGN